MIPKVDKDFFILLRIGLWQRVEEELSPNPNWDYILQLAKEQTVQGIVADGIGIYLKYLETRNEKPETEFITQEQYDKFLSASAQIVRQNFAINNLQAKVCKLFEERNITYAILKGQGIAQCYPKPLLRCSGDIDYLVPSEDTDDYDRARELMFALSSGHDPYNERELHQGFFFDAPNASQSLDVEIHGTARSYFADKLDRVIEAERQKMFKEKNFHKVLVSGVAINTPSLEYHALFLVCHILKHVFNKGVGLRQFCDLAMFMSAYKDDINQEYLQELIRESGIQKLWNMIFRFLNLSIAPDLIDICHQQTFFRKSDADCMRLWGDCKDTGNFGQTMETERSEKFAADFKERNVYILQSANSKFVRCWKYSPSLALEMYLNFLSRHISLGYKKMFHIGGMKFNR